MNALELVEQLMKVDPRLAIEVATSERKDEWYEIAEVEVTENFRGNTVVVLHTD